MKYMVMIIGVFACLLSLSRGQGQDKARADGRNAGRVVMVSLGPPVLNDRAISWRFQIRNDSAEDVWICRSTGYVSCEIRMADDGETLLIQRHLNLPMPGIMPQPAGIYVRLRGGEIRTEHMSLTLPIRPTYVLSDRRPDQPLEYAKRIRLEIGYYEGDLPSMVMGILQQAEMTPKTYPSDLPIEEYGPSYLLGGMMGFLEFNEGWRNRTETVLIHYTWQSLKGERVVYLNADDLQIPYLERREPATTPDLANCTRIEVKFNPSALDFFFPYPDEKNLLDEPEKRLLMSLDTVVMRDQMSLEYLVGRIRESQPEGAFVLEHSMAELRCYHDDEQIHFLRMYAPSTIMDENGLVIRCPEHLPSQTMLPSKMQGFELRMQCASHLKDLWHRMRTYDKKNKTYPSPRRWADEIVAKLKASKWRDSRIMRCFQCPSAPDGKSHYAMNVNCMYDSPGDMVLLFEIKPGWIRGRWNQHGGPKLFTFDNHEPPGGLVLLNDGTVKFIRTEEELKQLRWK